MGTTIKKHAVSAVAGLSALMLQATSALATDPAPVTWGDILYGKSNGNNHIIDIRVPSGEAQAWVDKGFNIGKFTKFLDEDFLACTDKVFFPFNEIRRSGERIIIGEAPDPRTSLSSPLSAWKIKEYRNCERKWLKKIFDTQKSLGTEIVEANIGKLDHLTTKWVGNILKLDNRTSAIVIKAHESGKDIVYKIKDFHENVAVEGQKLAKGFGDLTKLITTNRDAILKGVQNPDLDKLIETKRAELQSVATGVSIIAKLAFRNDPVAVARIETGMSAIVKISDTMAKLSSTKIMDNASKVLLSANMVTGALALVSMFGSQNSESDMIFEQFRELKKDVATLRKEMHERFDRLEDIIIKAVEHLDRRLNDISNRLSDIERKVDSVLQKQDALYELSRASFEWLIVNNFAHEMSKCENQSFQGAKSETDALECITDAARFGIEGNNIAAIISSSSIYNNGGKDQIDEAAIAAERLFEENKVGYLDAVLRLAKRHEYIAGYSLSQDKLFSPVDWARSVDAFAKYITDPGQFVALKGKHTKDSLLSQDLFSTSVTNLKDRGEEAKKSITVIRKEGVSFALDRLQIKIKDLEIALLKEDSDQRFDRKDYKTGFSIRYLIEPFGTIKEEVDEAYKNTYHRPSSGISAIRNACDHVAAARRAVDMYAGLSRTSFSKADDRWRDAQANLPARSGKEVCSETFNLIVSFDKERGWRQRRSKPLEDFQRYFGGNFGYLRSSFRADGGMDIIDSRLQALEVLTAGDPTP